MNEQEKSSEEREVTISFQVVFVEKITPPTNRTDIVNKAVREFLDEVEKPRDYPDDEGTPNNFVASNGALVSWKPFKNQGESDE